MPRRGGEGPPRRVRNPQLEEKILDEIAENPFNSVRKLSDQVHASKWVVHETLQNQLLHPYHVQKVHAMSPADYPARVSYANWFLGNSYRIQILPV